MISFYKKNDMWKYALDFADFQKSWSAMRNESIINTYGAN